MKRSCIPVGMILLLGAIPAFAEEGFVSLFDGETFDGWKVSEENSGSFVIEERAFVTRGPRAHLYYVGELAPFKNFELKVEVKAENGSNGGIYFHTAYQAEDWPRAGFESQVNVSGSDWKKSGSIYDIANVGFTPVQDGVWYTHHIIVEGNSVTVRLNGVVVVQYKEPKGAQPGERFERVLNKGTIALQCHDPDSVVYYRNIRIKRLPDILEN